MDEFEARLARTLGAHRLLAPGARVVVAVSGGADSVALLHALRALQSAWKLTLAIAHLDHTLRPDSAQDAAFVQQLGARLGLEPLARANPEILPAFIAALRDRKPEVRMTAVDIVSRIDDPRARKAILLRNKRERDRNVRRVLSLAMTRLNR